MKKVLPFLLFLLVSSLWADNPHFTSGPTATLNGSTLTACATMAGLGNTVIDVTLACSNVTFQCINKAGNVNNANQTLSTTTEFQPHNGTVKNACVSLVPSCPPGQAGPFNVVYNSCSYSVTEGGSVILSQPLTLP